jgi:hypothetical protein
MGMLDRYYKAGGFVQLLALLETCGPIKQQKFMDIIKTEDARWADVLKTKLLSLEKIYSWNDETLAEIVGTMQDLTVAVILTAGTDEFKARINGMLSHGRRRKVEDLMGASNPTQGEISAMNMKIIESVRKMAQEGSLRFEKFDPSMIIEDDIEDKLKKGLLGNVNSYEGITPQSFEIETSVPNESYDAGTGGGDRVVEIQSLKKKVAELSKETAVLRHELSIARGKLDQIKKIA